MQLNWEAVQLAHVGALLPLSVLLVTSMATLVILLRTRTTQRTPVNVYRYITLGAGKHNVGKQYRGKAEFLAWGHDYEEFEEGSKKDPAAIVLFSDGNVELIPAALVEFIK